MKRRAFLDWMTRTLGVALAGLVGYPVARYLVPPKMPEAATRRAQAAKKDELSPGQFKIFPFGGRPGILIRLPDGTYRALSAECTHLSCTVRYRNSDRSIWCPCHNGVYDLDGKNVSGPPPRPLEAYAVHVVGDEVVVEKSKTS